MSDAPTAADWLEWLAVLGLGGAAVVLLIALAERWIRSPAWRRTLWQTAVITLLLMLAAELTGTATLISDSAPRLMARRTESFRPQAHAIDVPSSGIPAEPARHAAAFQSNRHAPRDESKSPDLGVVPCEGPEPHFDDHELSNAAGAARTVQPIAEAHLVKLDAPVPAQRAAPATTRTDRPNRPGTIVNWWPGVMWIGGAGLIIVWFAAARVLLAICRRRRFTSVEPALRDRVIALAGRLGMRRRVAVLQARELAGPIAFGVLRPTVALPARFAEQYDSVQQDAILAHELGHLAGADPAWYALSDAAAAAFWWHPLVWWSRVRLRASSELAADEASQLVTDGPRVLATCLVALGDRLTRRPAAGWARMAGSGFRSSLGRRVERLMQLDGTRSSRPRRLLRWPATLLGVVLFSLIIAGGTTWARHNSFESGESTMNPMHSAWRKSLAGMFVVGALGWNHSPALPAQDRDPAVETTAENAPGSEEVQRDPSAQAPSDDAGADDADDNSAAPVNGPFGGQDVVAGPDVADDSAEPQDQPTEGDAVVKITLTIDGDPAKAESQVRQVLDLLKQAESTKGVRVVLDVVNQNWDEFTPHDGPPRRRARTQRPASESSIRVFRLKHRDPAEMVEAVWPHLSLRQPDGSILYIGSKHEQPHLVADVRTRSLLARGTEQQLRRVAAVIEMLDVTHGERRPQADGLRVFQLRYASAEEVGALLTSLAVQASTTVDTRLNSLLVSGTPEQIAEVEAVIEQLDVESSKPAGADGANVGDVQRSRFMVGAGIDSGNSVIGTKELIERDKRYRPTLLVTASGQVWINDTLVETQVLRERVRGAERVQIVADLAATYSRVQFVIDACRKAGVKNVQVMMGKLSQPPDESTPRAR